jgi:hypothetical protein
MMTRMTPSNEAADKQTDKTQHNTEQRAITESHYNAPTRTDVPHSDMMAA